MPQRNLLQTLLSQVVTAFARLESLSSPAQAVAFFRNLGYELPPAAVSAGLPQVVARAKDLRVLSDPLSSASAEADIAAQIVKALAGLAGVTQALEALHGQLQGA